MITREGDAVMEGSDRVEMMPGSTHSANPGKPNKNLSGHEDVRTIKAVRTSTAGQEFHRRQSAKAI
jgi:hypothetical protein